MKTVMVTIDETEDQVPFQLKAYVDDGGEDTYYLDGKEAALSLAVVDQRRSRVGLTAEQFHALPGDALDLR